MRPWRYQRDADGRKPFPPALASWAVSVVPLRVRGSVWPVKACLFSCGGRFRNCVLFSVGEGGQTEWCNCWSLVFVLAGCAESCISGLIPALPGRCRDTKFCVSTGRGTLFCAVAGICLTLERIAAPGRPNKKIRMPNNIRILSQSPTTNICRGE